MERIWQKSYVRGVPSDISFDEVTLDEALIRTASRFPDNPALIFQGTVMTYRELEETVSRFAHALQTLGVSPGDRVGFLLPNIVQTVVGIYGALRAGATVVMHNPRAGDMALQHQLNDSRPEVLVCLDVLVPRMIKLRQRTDVRKIISCHIRDYLPYLKKQIFPLVKSQLHLSTPDESEIYEFVDLVDSSDKRVHGFQSDFAETAFILYTSATTGTSKGVELTHQNLATNTLQIHSWFPSFRDGQEIVVGCLPFFHVFGLTCALNIAIFYGYANALVPLPEPKPIVEAVQSSKATFIPALPTFYNAYVNSPKLHKFDTSSLKGCFSGGAPLPLDTVRSFEKLTNAQICEGYGLTESSPVTHINPYGGKTKVGTIGLPLPSTDAKIVDTEDREKEVTTPGVPGELCVKGPQIMKGYINLPDVTQKTVRDGWLYTGDIVTMDNEGYFTVVDRKNDIIVSGGQNVFPRQVEEVLFSHPKVQDACVTGTTLGSSEERVTAFVVLKDGENATEDEIIDYCLRELEDYQAPALVTFFDELPRSPVGKTLRSEAKRLHMIRRRS